MTVEIQPFKKYTKKEIASLLELSDDKLKKAEEKKYLVFFDGGMYGVYLFQFLRSYSKQLEEIHYE